MISLHHGDCFWVLPKLEPCSVDALLCDPPSGIGFMGKEWDKDRGGRTQWIRYWAVRFRRALEVLKPGAHGLVWALPRTSHWTATALEDAGFEIRDVGVHIFAQGMPKSLDVSKAIDKAAGATRPVVGTRKLTGNAALSTKEKRGTYGVGVGTAPAKEVPVTAAATEAAREWDGWGTALKPAAEHWILVRKPLDGTVAANVLAHRTGAINIDAGRVFTDWSERPESWKRSGHSAKPDAPKIAAPPGTGINCHPKGRWPANVTLEHHSDCELLGSKKVRGSNVAGPAPEAGPAWFPGAGFAHQAGAARARAQELAPDGFETVEDWRCHDDCPIRILDEQSGELKSGFMAAGTMRAGNRIYNDLSGLVASDTIGDRGGASRFFYCAKASRAERGEDNDHPTVKPLELMRHFVRLITPPGGTVLDITMGSGTTMLAAQAEGFGAIGIEIDGKSYRIARKRLRTDAPLFANLERSSA